MDKPCHLLGCLEYGKTGHHHHFAYGHESPIVCKCDQKG